MKLFPTVSLLVSTYNWPSALEICLESIRHQTISPNEIIIADDGSLAETKELINNFQKLFSIPLIHVWHEDIGFRKSIIMNKAVKESSCDYLIMTDGDIILDKYFVEDHLSVAELGYFIQGSRALLSDLKSKKALETKQISFKIFENGILNPYNAIRCPLLSKITTVKDYESRALKGCNMSLWKKDFILVNGYNNLIQGWGHEDIELGARLVNNKIKRKKIKFLLTCYHIYHKLQSRSNESQNLLQYNTVINNKIKYCKNGYNEAIK